MTTKSSTLDESPIALYSYKVLSGPDNIRTIRLHAKNSRIECSFEETSVSEGGYQALSMFGVTSRNLSGL